MLADTASEAQTVLEACALCSASLVIPPKSARRIQREYDAHLYQARTDIECFFQRLKQFRHLATRYDKLVRTYQAFLLGLLYMSAQTQYIRLLSE